MPDDLFTPTITAGPPRPARPPWRPSSLLVPAILGGATAGTALALLNAGRLGLDRRARLTILGAGLLAVAGRIAVTLALLPTTENGGPARAVGALAGGLAWLAVAATQKGPYRAFELHGGEPARLWVPGLIAFLVGGFAEALLVLLATRMVQG